MSLPANPHNSKLLYGTKPQIKANGQDAGLVTVRLRDACQRPVSGQTVVLVTDSPDVTIEQPSPTNAEGLAFGFVRSSTPGPVVVRGIIQPLTETTN